MSQMTVAFQKVGKQRQQSLFYSSYITDYESLRICISDSHLTSKNFVVSSVFNYIRSCLRWRFMANLREESVTH